MLAMYVHCMVVCVHVTPSMQLQHTELPTVISAAELEPLLIVDKSRSKVWERGTSGLRFPSRSAPDLGRDPHVYMLSFARARIIVQLITR